MGDGGPGFVNGRFDPSNGVQRCDDGGVVNRDSSVYYTGGHWNELQAVRDHLNRLATGVSDRPWYRHLADWHGKPFRKALILNCGNGWVDRDLVRDHVIEEGVGIDCSGGLIAEARRVAAEQSLPLRYYEVDTNRADWPEGDYDLVVNHAAAHHISHLDRVFRSLAELLPDDGLLVSWDYIGPHRFQYRADQWEAAWEVNRSLPVELRQDLEYLHLPGMVAGDPTEAVHSELILPTLRRYFDDEYSRMLGGCIGYLLLSFNQKVLSAEPATVADVVDQVLAADVAFTSLAPERNSLFTYLISRPKDSALDETEQLDRWCQEEERREATAQVNGGVYYPPTLMAELLHPPIGRMLAFVHGARAQIARIPGARRAWHLLRSRS